jgi:hypothetical protein
MSTPKKSPYDPYIHDGGQGTDIHDGGQGTDIHDGGQRTDIHDGGQRTDALQAVRHHLCLSQKQSVQQLSHYCKAAVIEMQWLGRARGELASAMRQRLGKFLPAPCISLRSAYTRSCRCVSSLISSNTCRRVTSFADSLPGNRQHRGHHAGQHQQGLRARSTSRLAAG